MAGGQERVLRRRIRTVQATKKITKAMELIAASQIVRAQNRMTANRPYRAGMARLALEVAMGDPGAARTLVAARPPANVALLAVVGDRGLSGPYNSSVLRATERLTVALGRQGASARLYTVGKKAPAYFRFRGIPVERSFEGVSERPTVDDARRVAGAVAASFLAEEVDHLVVVSTRYHSAGSQSVEVHQLLPFPAPGAPPTFGIDGRLAEGAGTGEEALPARHGGYTEFEPDVADILADVVSRAVESEVFTALLEGAASFFTAQQRAMAAATDNADELIRTLSRIMNRARQDAITTEIMEIVGGAEALRHSKGA